MSQFQNAEDRWLGKGWEDVAKDFCLARGFGVHSFAFQNLGDRYQSVDENGVRTVIYDSTIEKEMGLCVGRYGGKIHKGIAMCRVISDAIGIAYGQTPASRERKSMMDGDWELKEETKPLGRRLGVALLHHGKEVAFYFKCDLAAEGRSFYIPNNTPQWVLERLIAYSAEARQAPRPSDALRDSGAPRGTFTAHAQCPRCGNVVRKEIPFEARDFPLSCCGHEFAIASFAVACRGV